MKSIISNTITRKMTIGIAILLVGIATFGITVFGITDKTYATESTLSLSIDNNSVKVDLAPTSTNGTFRKGTASTISASTDNATGYTISISAPSASGSDYDKLVNTSDNTAKISSISSPTTEEQYKALNNTSYNNTWGYLPSKYCSDGTSSTCATNTDFLPAPTIAGDVLDQTTAANTTANTYTIGMGTRIDSTTKTGKYQGPFIVKLVANAIPYSIIYDDNVVSNMPTDVSSTTPDTSVTIDSKVPVRAGYKFLGWCLGTEDVSNITTSNGTDTCSSTIYQPNSTLSIDQTGTGNNFRLYAMWKELITFNKAYAAAGKTQSGGYYIMQDANASICSAVDEGQVGEVKDSRDGTIYHIGKLKDGKCWLLDNLALDLVAHKNDLSSTNTNASDEILAYLKNGGGSGQYPANGVKAKNKDGSGSWTNSYTDPYIATGYENDIPSDTTSQSGQYKVGVYYNYCAASAGSYCYDISSTTPSDQQNGVRNIDADICPKGWRMPTGNTSGEYSALANAIYGFTGDTNDSTAYANYRDALRLPLSGYFSNGSADSQGSYGDFWSSTRSNNNFMCTLYLRTDSVDPVDHNGRNYGQSVRCVLGS